MVIAAVLGNSTVLDVLAAPPGQPDVNNFGDTRSGGLAGPIGLLVVVLLGLATVLLIRNMNSRLRRLPREFPDEPVVGPTKDDIAAS